MIQKLPVNTSVFKLLIMITFGVFAGPSVLIGQMPEPMESEFSWRAFGGPNISTTGTGLSAGISFQNRNHQFTLRAVSTDPDPQESTWEIGVLYGQSTSSNSLLLSAGAGFSVVGGKRYPRLIADDRQERLEPMIGFPLEGRAVWQPTGYVGIGLYGFANINTGQPFGGLGLMMHLGKF